MSVPLLIHWILMKCILVVDSAPKIELRSLRNDIYDPLSESSDSYLSYEMAVPQLRKAISQEEVKMNAQYEGYIFNENICKDVNNRILCGYDKNKGEYVSHYDIVDLGNGCRSRGDRIECGYDNAQYNNHLRHPVEKGVRGEEHVVENHDELARQAPTRTGQPSTRADMPTTSKIYDKLLKISSPDHVQTEQTTPSTKLFEPVPSSSAVLPDQLTTATTVNKIDTTEFESTQVPESTHTFESTITESSPTLLTTKMITTFTSESSELENISSDSEAIKRIIHMKSDEEKVPIQNNRRLTEVISTLAELNTKSNTNIVSTIAPLFVSNCETTKNTGLRIKTNGGEIISTACVEKQDRVVCYDFKTQ